MAKQRRPTVGHKPQYIMDVSVIIWDLSLCVPGRSRMEPYTESKHARLGRDHVCI
jgi:hypothetical protein